MDWNMLISIILTAGIYAVMAFGLSLIFGVMKIVNLAHAGAMMLGAYFTYELVMNGKLNLFLAIPMVVFVLLGIGMLLEKALIFPLPVAERKGLTSLLALVGAWMVIQNGAYLIWGPDQLSVLLDELTFKSIDIGPVQVGLLRLIILLIAILSLLIIHLFLNRTLLGKSIRAASENPTACSLVGIKVEQVFMVSFGIGIAFAGLGGSLMSLLYAFTPEFGSQFVVKCFAVVIMGGLGNFVGTIVGSLVLATAEMAGASIWGLNWQNAIVFISMILVIVFMPDGIVPSLAKIRIRMFKRGIMEKGGKIGK